MAKTEEKELTFEESLEKLENIVKKLESGEVPLDDAINEFNEAMLLAKKCDEKLKAAEEAITKIVNPDGSLSDFKVEELYISTTNKKARDYITVVNYPYKEKFILDNLMDEAIDKDNIVLINLN